VIEVNMQLFSSRRVLLVAGLAVLVVVSGRSGSGQGRDSSDQRHARYRVVDLGTLGGPESYMNEGDGPFFPPSTILNSAGRVAAVSDTTIPDVYKAFSNPSPGMPTNLGVLPAGAAVGSQRPCFDCAWPSWAFWISDSGTIVGQSGDGTIDPLTADQKVFAVAWKGGKIVNLGTLGGNQSTAGAVNRRGDVAGAALNQTIDAFPGRFPYNDFFFFGSGTESHAVLWRDGETHDLGTLGGPDSAAFLVNEDGLVAGASDVDFGAYPSVENPGGGPMVHPFLWQDGRMRDLIADAPAGMFGGTYGIATWLNNRGQVTGTMNLTGDRTWRSFFWDRGVVQDLGTLGGIITTPSWLSETGAVVGKSDVTDICTTCAPGNQKQLHHPFIWKRGVMTDLGVLPGDNAGSAFSINRHEQIVGRSLTCLKVTAGDGCDGVYRAFLWERGSLVDLQSLVVPGTGLTVDGAEEINDRGEIIGSGLLPNGDRHAVLLIPVDRDGGDDHGGEHHAGDAHGRGRIGTTFGDRR
jgi:uncharacterized membrane protein